MVVLNEKMSEAYKTRRTPLTARPMDLLYFIFFASHLVASLLIDLQWLYPPSIVPTPMRELLNYYVQFSNDPLVGGLAGIKDDSALLWFKTFITLEGIFQIPVFIIGLLALWKDHKKTYPLLLIYAASSATTTLPCITYVLSLPAPTIKTTILDHTATFEQRLILLSGYVPFFTIPFIMVFDFGRRVYKLITAAVQMQEKKLD